MSEVKCRGCGGDGIIHPGMGKPPKKCSICKGKGYMEYIEAYNPTQIRR